MSAFAEKWRGAWKDHEAEAAELRARVATLEDAIIRAHKIIAANYMHQREKVDDGLVILRNAIAK